jgi:hypothetical protein
LLTLAIHDEVVGEARHYILVQQQQQIAEFKFAIMALAQAML